MCPLNCLCESGSMVDPGDERGAGPSGGKTPLGYNGHIVPIRGSVGHREPRYEF